MHLIKRYATILQLVMIAPAIANGAGQNTANARPHLSIDSEENPWAKLKGLITTSDGKPVPFATVSLRGTNKAAVTDEQGTYWIEKVKAGHYTVMVTFVGMKPVSQTIALEPGKEQELNLTLTDHSEQLQEVIVSTKGTHKYVETAPSASLRLNAPLIEIPQNISIVTRQMMQDFGVLGTADMARMTSGVILRSSGNNDVSFIIRGTDAANNTFRNGIGGYWWNQQADAFMLERVEFVKGPAGFMIGNSEPGGMLNQVTKQADGRTVREVEIGYGSWNLLRGGVDVGGKFSPSSRFSYRLVAGGQRTNAQYDFYRNSRVYVLPSVRYTYGNGSHLQLELTRMDGHVIGNNPYNISFNGHDRLFPATFNAVDPNMMRGTETDDNYVRLSHTHQFRGGWQLKAQLADVRGVFQGDGMYVDRVATRFDTLYRKYYANSWRNELRAAQVFVDGKFRTGPHIEHSILSGIDYGRTRVRSVYAPDNDSSFPLLVSHPVYNLTPADIGTITANPENDWGTRWLAWYTQDHIKLFDKVIVTLAGRLSHTKSWANYDSTTVYDTKFTPRLGLTYLISKQASLYALFDETFLPQTGQKSDGTNPRPLTGTNTEIGFKSRWNKGRLALNSSLFRTVKNNVLVQNPLTQLYDERGQILSQGFEIDVTGNLTNGLIVNANYTFTDARITRDAEPDNVGFRNFLVGRNAGNAMVRYRFLRGRLNGWSAGLGTQLMSEQSAAYAGYTDPKDKNIVFPSYTLFDANLAYEARRWSLRVNAFNLLNKKVIENAWWSSATETMPGYFSFSPNQPINARVMANYRF